jgi:hypothetical protein
MLNVLLVQPLGIASPKPIQTTVQDLKYHAKFVRASLAGSQLNPSQKNFLKFNKKEGYYLYYSSDGLGRLMSMKLVLCPDLNRLDVHYPKGPTAKRNIEMNSLPRLRTGKGVNLGNSPQQVQRNLGSPPQISKYNYKTGEHVYTWKSPIAVKANSRWQNWAYHGIYTFRNERLWTITYWAVDETENYWD